MNPTSRATFEPKAKNFGAQLVSSASLFVGKSRAENPDQIAELLSLFQLPYKYERGAPVPYCAAGIAFAAAMAYAESLQKNINKFNKVAVLRQVLDEIDHWYFYPTPSVWSLYYVSAGKGTWKAGAPGSVIPLPGWLVVYDFGKGADHCGIVETATSEILNTIEFNTTITHGSETNGGVITRKQRKYDSTVKGFVRL